MPTQFRPLIQAIVPSSFRTRPTGKSSGAGRSREPGFEFKDNVRLKSNFSFQDRSGFQYLPETATGHENEITGGTAMEGRGSERMRGMPSNGIQVTHKISTESEETGA